MSEALPPDLPPDIAALLRDGRDLPAPPPEERRKVAARLALTTGLAIPSASLAGAKLMAGASLARAALVAVVVAAAGSVAVGTLRPSPARPSAPRTSTAAPRLRAPAPTVVAPRAVAPAVVPTPVVSAPPAPVLAARPSPPRRPNLVAPRAGLTSVGDEALAEELALLSEAHATLARGEVAAAEGALARHARRHPQGSLTPEREALRVECLAARGERAAAEAARASFHRRFPGSVLGAAVDRAVGDDP